MNVLIQHHDIDGFPLDESPHLPGQRQLNANEPRENSSGRSQFAQAFETRVKKTGDAGGGIRRGRPRELEKDHRESSRSKFLKGLAWIGKIQSSDDVCPRVVEVKNKVPNEIDRSPRSRAALEQENADGTRARRFSLGHQPAPR